VIVRLLGGLAITVMTLYCSPRRRGGKGRGPEGSGLYPELASISTARVPTNTS
jgi:hypothetical protein